MAKRRITQNEVENCLIALSESVKTINHNSGRTADAMEKIAENINKGFAGNEIYHKTFDKNQNKLIKILIIAVIALSGANFAPSLISAIKALFGLP